MPLALSGTALATLAPIFKSGCSTPCWTASCTSTSSVPLLVSAATFRRRPDSLPALPTVMAMRTWAPSAASTHGWSGMAKASDNGALLSLRWRSRIRRWNTWVMLLVVMKPKRWATPLRTFSAAISHQYMTKSAFCGMSGYSDQTAST
ncbi:hypothetical protein D3C78_1044320 [compost metagenome]